MRMPTDLHPDDTVARDQLAGRLRRIREGRRISQRGLADMLDIDHTNASGLELRRTWKIRTVQRWARVLGYRLDLGITGGVVVPDDGDALAAVYAAQQPTTEDAEDLLDLRALINDVRRIRIASGITLAEMGRRLGCGPSSVSHREADPDGAMLVSAQRYVRALGGALRVELEPGWAETTQ